MRAGDHRDRQGYTDLWGHPSFGICRSSVATSQDAAHVRRDGLAIVAARMVLAYAADLAGAFGRNLVRIGLAEKPGVYLPTSGRFSRHGGRGPALEMSSQWLRLGDRADYRQELRRGSACIPQTRGRDAATRDPQDSDIGLP